MGVLSALRLEPNSIDSIEWIKQSLQPFLYSDTIVQGAKLVEAAL